MKTVALREPVTTRWWRVAYRKDRPNSNGSLFEIQIGPARGRR